MTAETGRQAQCRSACTCQDPAAFAATCVCWWYGALGHPKTYSRGRVSQARRLHSLPTTMQSAIGGVLQQQTTRVVRHEPSCSMSNISSPLRRRSCLVKPWPQPMQTHGTRVSMQRTHAISSNISLPSFVLLSTALDQLRLLDQPWVNTVLSTPALALLVSLLLLRLVPAVTNRFMRWVATPILVLLLLAVIVSHPSELLAVLRAIQGFVEAQPEASSVIVLLLAVLALAPYLMLAVGALAVADVLLSLVLQK